MAGGGTVNYVIGYSLDTDISYVKDPATREMAGTPNVIGFYRAALTFEIQNLIGIDLIKFREKANAKYFYQQISEFNQNNKSSGRFVKIYGDANLSTRLAVFPFNIYGPGTYKDSENRAMFHPHFVGRRKPFYFKKVFLIF